LANGLEFEQAVGAIGAGCSVLLLGETGQGSNQLAQRVAEHYARSLDVAIVTYKGTAKQFFQGLAKQLGCPTETELDEKGRSKPLTVDQLKEEIAQNVGSETLLVFPEAKRLSASIRYWLEDLMGDGVRVVATAVVNPGRDIFLDMVLIEMALPDDGVIRSVMQSEARRHGLALSESRLASLQPLAGRNPAIARKVVRNEALGLRQDRPEHTQYLDISPLILAATCTLGLLRFVGQGTGNKSLYIVGGVAMMIGLSLKYLGKIQGAKRRYGQ
jgi:hypothetical protein